MGLLGIPLPSPPTFDVDVQAIETKLEFIAEMRECPQSPEHHGEGDVATHTLMVVQELSALPRFRELDETSRGILFTAALLHDVAKPAATREELGQLTARGHSGRGEVMARRLLWELETPIVVREHICQLIRAHEVPFFLVDAHDSTRRAIELSQLLSNELLSLLAEADARGRVSASKTEMLENVELFAELCREAECFDRAFPFANAQSRFEYFRTPQRAAHYEAYDDTRCEMTMLVGLPGAGKDHWVEVHAPTLPTVSLDDIRAELGAPATGNQGAVVQAARERARELLRAEQSFIWNATNLSRKIRRSIVDLAARYSARIRIQSIEVTSARLFQQNNDRERSVPIQAYESLLARWQTPDVTEAQRVYWNNDAAGW